VNARKELLKHVTDTGREVRYVHVILGSEYSCRRMTVRGTLPEVLPLLDFEYDNGYGGQELFGNVWYTDGTWSERGEYDGSEWWEHKVCPPIPEEKEVTP